MALAADNIIAYNKPLRIQLEEVHNLLGEQATDAASSAMLYGTRTIGQIQQVIKAMSTLAASVSVILLEIKSNKDLNDSEKDDLEGIKRFAAKLGNAQFELLDLIGEINKFNELAGDISNKGVQAATTIIDLQQELMDIRSNINAVGYLSKNPELASLFETENPKN